MTTPSPAPILQTRLRSLFNNKPKHFYQTTKVSKAVSPARDTHKKPKKVVKVEKVSASEKTKIKKRVEGFLKNIGSQEYDEETANTGRG